MKRLPLIVVVMGMWGCAGQPTPGHSLYTPGEKLLMTYQTKVRMEYVSESPTSYPTPSENAQSRPNPSGKDRPFQEMTYQQDLTVDVRPSDRPDQSELAIRIRRMRGNASYGSSENPAREEWDSDKPFAKEDAGHDMREYLKFEYSAVVDKTGRVVKFDARGEPFDQLRKDPLTMQGMSMDLLLQIHSFGVGYPLSAAPAYLPPADAFAGQRWDLTRENVFSGAPVFVVAMCIGNPLSTERATCTVESVDATPAGRIVTVAIAGRRTLPSLDSSTPPVDYMTTTGRLKFNLDTGAIPELRIETKPHYTSAEDRRSKDLTFIDTIRLEKR